MQFFCNIPQKIVLILDHYKDTHMGAFKRKALDC